jgi:hypothetical protein
MKDLISVGDSVMWRGAWGSESAKPVRVTAMELCAAPRQKHGVPVTEVPRTLKDYVNFTLDNGHWAYGYQIELLDEQSRTMRECFEEGNRYGI